MPYAQARVVLRSRLPAAQGRPVPVRTLGKRPETPPAKRGARRADAPPPGLFVRSRPNPEKTRSGGSIAMNSSRCGPTRGRAPATSEIEVRPDISLVRPTRVNSKHRARTGPSLSPRVDGATEQLSWSLKDGSAGSTPPLHKRRARHHACDPPALEILVAGRSARSVYRQTCCAPTN